MKMPITDAINPYMLLLKYRPYIIKNSPIKLLVNGILILLNINIKNSAPNIGIHFINPE